MGMGKKQTVGYRYYMGVHMGLCHGPVDALLAIEVGGRVAWSGTQTTSGVISVNAPELFGGDDREGGVLGNLDVMMGEATQAPNAYLAAQLGANQPAYRGMFGVVFNGPTGAGVSQALAGNSGWAGWINRILSGRPSGLIGSNNPYPKPWAFRIRRILSGWTGATWYSARASVTVGGGIQAMNPAHIVLECLTNPEWGLGYPQGQLDLASFTAAADAFHTEGLGLCLAWQQQDSIQSFLQLVLDHAGAVLVEDRTTGLFRLRAVRGDYTVASLPLFSSTTGTVLEVSRIDRATFTEGVNEITVAYVDAATGKDGSVTVQQLANIQAQGAVVPETRQYPGLPTAQLALRTAMRDLAVATSGLARVTMTVNRAGYSIVPGDVVRFQWEPGGIAQLVLRVASVDYGTLTDGAVTLECVEDVFSLPSTAYVNAQGPGWVDPSGPPQAPPFVLAMEAPFRELFQTLGRDDALAVTANDGYLAAAAVRPAGAATNYALDTMPPGGSFEERAVADWCPSATLAANITPATTVVQVASVADLFAVQAGTMAQLGSGATAELVHVVSADSVGSTVTVARGCVDTVPRAHASGTRLLFLDDYLATDSREYALNETVQARFRTMAATGSLPSNLAPTASVTMASRAVRPYPPGNLRMNGAAYPASISSTLTVSWAHRDRLAQEDQLVDTTAASIGPEAGTTYTLRLYDENGTLRRTESGLTGTTYTWANEATDSGLLVPPSGEHTSITWAQSSVYGAGLTATATNMRDGSPSTGAATNNGADEWIRADLGSAQSVQTVWVAGGSLSGWGAVAAYLNGRTIQWSNDLTNWTTAATISGANDTGSPLAVTFGAVAARYWRIRTSGWVATTEFRLFSGTGGGTRLNTQVRAELWAVRGGLDSFQRHDLTVPRV